MNNSGFTQNRLTVDLGLKKSKKKRKAKKIKRKRKNIKPTNLMDKRIYIGETAFEYFTNIDLF